MHFLHIFSLRSLTVLPIFAKPWAQQGDIMRKLAVFFVIVSLLAGAGGAAAQQAQKAPDSWVLALSWSPSWCNGRGGETDAEQCGKGKRLAFVVHGLWPQYKRGERPDCSAAGGVPRDVADRAAAIMPSHQLIDHEWTKHGSCTGLSAAEYFGKTRQASDRVKIPAAFKSADKAQSIPVTQIEKAFADVNPGLTAGAIAVGCRGDRLNEVRVCLDKDMKFIECRRSIRDTCSGDARFEAAK
jgi:ribonuclease T2